MSKGIAAGWGGIGRGGSVPAPGLFGLRSLRGDPDVPKTPYSWGGETVAD